MIKTAAVVAHFDPENRFDPTFRLLVYTLMEVCDLVVVVTTCQLAPEEIFQESMVVTIQRPNIGYDFYSYRVGINEILRRGGTERLFLLNSSFLILDSRCFAGTLTGMIRCLASASIVGCTESCQLKWHLQSYLLLFRGEVLFCDWFQRWLLTIEPHNTKLETIMAGEFGLAMAIKENRVATRYFFRLTARERLRASIAWIRYVAKGGMGAFVRGLRHIFGFNIVHFAAYPLARRCGIAKAELLRDNPCGVALDWQRDVSGVSERKMIARFVARSRPYYRPARSGLTILRNGETAIPVLRLVCSGPLARPGVRLAVVVHLFYPELIDEIRGWLRSILEPFDLFVTTSHEGVVPAIFNGFGRLAQTVAVALCENRGRDIGPFMAVYRQKLLESYDAVLKVHGKRSTYSEEGNFWRRRIFKELTGDSMVVHRSLDLIRRRNVGIVGPHEDYLTNEKYWGANRERVFNLLRLSGTSNLGNMELGFFAGSMFWFRPEAIAFLHTIPEEHLVFEPESGMQDGTLAHVLERVFCNVARSAGYVVTSVPMAGCDLRDLNTDGNTVPVLGERYQSVSLRDKDRLLAL